MSTDDTPGLEDHPFQFRIYGTMAGEHKDDNSDLSGSDQLDVRYELIYSTDDREEAKAIIVAGGFTREDVWYVAVWAEDTVNGGTMGEKPTSVASTRTASAIKKTDF